MAKVARTSRKYQATPQFVLYLAMAASLGYFYALTTHEGLISPRRAAFDLPRSARAHILFSAEDDVNGALRKLIDAEQRHICFSMYYLTDPVIADALIAAHERGVHVEGVVDRSFRKTASSKVGRLAAAGIPLWVFKPDASDSEGIMHNKFFTFTGHEEAQPLVWTGSFNITRRAQLKNEENVLILQHTQAVQAYNSYFERLKQRSVRLATKSVKRAKKMRPSLVSQICTCLGI